MITNYLNKKEMKTLKSTTTTILILALVMLPVFSMAQKVSQVIETEEFSAIKVSSIFKVELIQGDNHFLELTGDERFLEDVNARVQNGVLRLDYSGRARNASIEATIITPVINSIDLSGAVSLSAGNTIESPSLKVKMSGATSATMEVQTASLESNISGASNLIISGMAAKHRAVASGASQIRAQNLVTGSTKVNVSGASHARINATESIDANASGTSRVVFANEPENVKVRTSGMASVNGTQAHMVNTSESGDTTRIRLGSRDLWIIEEEGKERVRVERRHRGFRNNWSGFEMGINGFLSPNNDFNLTGDAELLEPRYGRSFTYNLNLIQQNLPIIRNNLGIYTGLGFTWNNYRFDNQTGIVYTREGLEIIEWEEKASRSSLRLTYLTVPLMLEFQTGGNRRAERFHIAGGMTLGTLIGSRARYVFDVEGDKRRVTDNHNFHIPPFRFDLTGRVGWGNVNLFANYSLNSLFKEDKGPEIYPFSVGIRLINF